MFAVWCLLNGVKLHQPIPQNFLIRQKEIPINLSYQLWIPTTAVHINYIGPLITINPYFFLTFVTRNMIILYGMNGIIVF
jgi:hypothetical protein